MTDPNQVRWKSWALWLSVAGLVGWLIKTLCGQDWGGEISMFMDMLCPVLVGFGIINDPTNKNGL